MKTFPILLSAHLSPPNPIPRPPRKTLKTLYFLIVQYEGFTFARNFVKPQR